MSETKEMQEAQLSKEAKAAEERDLYTRQFITRVEARNCQTARCLLSFPCATVPL